MQKKILLFIAAFIIVFIVVVYVTMHSSGIRSSLNAGTASSSDALSVVEGASSTSPTDQPPALSQNVYMPPAPLGTTIPVGYNLYRSAPFHFSLLYSENTSVTEYHEQGGGLTVTFDDVGEDKTFQVYVTPYAGKTITPARFKADEPSGVMQQSTDVVIDGTRATMFFSKNDIMGDTREVWFVHGGFLYEVTTYKEYDTWLAHIMTTWKFI